MTEAHHDVAVEPPQRGARLGNAGEATACERANRRGGHARVQSKGREAREERRRRATSFPHISDGRPLQDWRPALPNTVWERHTVELAGGWDGCYPHARDVPQPLAND
jgi:hypothetical protein